MLASELIDSLQQFIRLYGDTYVVMDCEGHNIVFEVVAVGHETSKRSEEHRYCLLSQDSPSWNFATPHLRIVK